MIGWSQFALDRHKEGAGNSYSRLPNNQILQLIVDHWLDRIPGQGETNLTRKVLVPIPPDLCHYFYVPTVAIREGLPIKAQVVVRQPGEDPYVEKFIEWDDAQKLGIVPEKAKYVSFVCYSADALLENGGTRSTNEDWEIVAILASLVEKEPMTPLTMARNFLQKVGGTASVYSAQEFAESIYYHATNGGIRIKRSNM